MMENDDTLIKNFMLANKHEIEDNGFSRGVIRRLPQPAQWLSDILSVTAPLSVVVLFYIFNGFEILCQTISDIVISQTYYLGKVMLISNHWLSPLRFLSSSAYNVYAA